jgi:hypothetical protein
VASDASVAIVIDPDAEVDVRPIVKLGTTVTGSVDPERTFDDLKSSRSNDASLAKRARSDERLVGRYVSSRLNRISAIVCTNNQKPHQAIPNRAIHLPACRTAAAWVSRYC